MERAKTIANGPSILSYLEETVEENNLREKIKFSHKVLSANWNSTERNWEVELLIMSKKYY